MEQISFAGLTIPGLIVLALILAGIIAGYVHGFFKEVLAVVCIVLPMALALALTPLATNILRENTRLYQKVESAVADFIDDNAQTINSQLSGLTSADAVNSEELIEKLQLPEFLAKVFDNFKLPEGFQNLNASSLKGSVSGYTADFVLHAAAFILAYLLATLVIHIISLLLNILAKVPGIKEGNKIAGAVLGGGKMLIYIWVAFLLLTVLLTSELGQSLFRVVNQDVLLRWLYNNNPLVRLLASLNL